jgi:tetratricopeptide (TPR) repeat protein
MTLFQALMERSARADAGLLSDTTAAFLSSPRPLTNKRWESWVKAELARLRGDPARSSRWLEVARRLGEERPPAGAVWTAECALTAGELLLAHGEPGEAFGYLRQAFEVWLSVFDTMMAPLTGGRLDRSVGKWVAEFAEALLGDEPHDIDPGSAAVIARWMQERLIPGTIKAGSSLVRVAGAVGATEVAERGVDALLDLLPKAVQGLALPLFVADLHRDLGNHYQSLGRFADAVRETELALKALEPVSADPQAAARVRELRFNRANGLARSGREVEAVSAYERLEDECRAAGEAEAALRTRYARLHHQWRAGRGAAIRDDLRRLVADYQALLRSTGTDGLEYAAARVALDQPYRLLLTVLAEGRSGGLDSLQELLGIVAALRDESSVVEADPVAGLPAADLPRALGSPVGLLDRRMRRLPGAVLLVLEPGVDCAVFIVLEGGNAPTAGRLTVATAGREIAAPAGSLLDEFKMSSSLLITRASGAKALDATPLRAAGEALTGAVPDSVRQALARAETVFYSPSPMANADEVPLELIRVDDDYLGLTRAVARIPSLKHLLQILAPNRVNRVPLRRAAVVRAVDPPELDPLGAADEDTANAARALGVLGFQTKIDRKPTARRLVRVLDSGIGLVHYVGHGMAVEAGEQLFLGPTERLAAYTLDALDGRRTPFVYLSSCLVGRGRHLAGGRLKGFAVALLQHGAPGVVAANYVVPDHVCAAISIAFYRGAWKAPVGEAMRLARRRLHADGFHPVCWSAFALHGDPYATVSGALAPDSAARRTLDWPALLTRSLATQDEAYRRACCARLKEAAQAQPGRRAVLDRVAAMLDTQPAPADPPADLVGELLAFDVEGAAAVHLLQAWRRIEALRAGEMSAQAREECRKLIGTALPLAARLDDSYAFVLFAAAHNELLTTTMEETLAVLRHAARCARAVEADRRGLRRAQGRIKSSLRGYESAIVFDAPGMLGVDPHLFQRADEGDEGALREINSQLLAREADLDLAVSGGHWKDWMLRYIATDTERVLKGLMAAVDQQRKRADGGGREVANLLWRYLSSYRGAGEADPLLYAALAEKLPPGSPERRALDLFRTFDQIVSNSTTYPRSLAVEGESAAAAAGHEGATVYFRMLLAQVDIREGRLVEARDLLLSVHEPLRRLAAEDSEYLKRLQAVVKNINALTHMIEGRRRSD